MTKEEIVGLLKRLENDNRVMAVLEKIADREKVVFFALELKNIDILAKLFVPIEFESNGTSKVIIYYDVFTLLATSNRVKNTLSIDDLRALNNKISPILRKEHEFDGLVSKIKIKDTHARVLPFNQKITKGLNDVLRFSEPACFLANLDLYNKNIDTIDCDTGACLEDNYHKEALCFTVIDYDMLTDDNKKYGQELISNGKAKFDYAEDKITKARKTRLIIFVKCNGEMTVREVSDSLLLITNNFKVQDIKEGKYTMDEYYNKLYPYLEKYAYAGGDFNKYFPTGDVYPLELLEFERVETPNGKNSTTVYDTELDLFFKDKITYRKYLNYINFVKSNS